MFDCVVYSSMAVLCVVNFRCALVGMPNFRTYSFFLLSVWILSFGGLECSSTTASPTTTDSAVVSTTATPAGTWSSESGGLSTTDSVSETTTTATITASAEDDTTPSLVNNPVVGPGWHPGSWLEWALR